MLTNDPYLTKKRMHFERYTQIAPYKNSKGSDIM